MIIKFTTFKGGQEYFEFDTDFLEEGEKLERFLLNTDDDRKIYIVPMIVKNKVMHYPLSVLERVLTTDEK